MHGKKWSLDAESLAYNSFPVQSVHHRKLHIETLNPAGVSTVSPPEKIIRDSEPNWAGSCEMEIILWTFGVKYFIVCLINLAVSVALFYHPIFNFQKLKLSFLNCKFIISSFKNGKIILGFYQKATIWRQIQRL